ncbi:hypothetical protein BJ508DRAFT_304040 [Ascobolus immersus RN42]|uniref:IPT/TIG domain-containing protein n=1 Tax=Ascobolus immersus RN42 TaxID=1160509 RepID=A0A3N4IJ79_ASCIM|nr:hypothetical protein BJ508DRAFT_304040 [Ascobolus immersus RN42]
MNTTFDTLMDSQHHDGDHGQSRYHLSQLDSSDFDKEFDDIIDQNAYDSYDPKDTTPDPNQLSSSVDSAEYYTSLSESSSPASRDSSSSRSNSHTRESSVSGSSSAMDLRFYEGLSTDGANEVLVRHDMAGTELQDTLGIDALMSDSSHLFPTLYPSKNPLQQKDTTQTASAPIQSPQQHPSTSSSAPSQNIIRFDSRPEIDPVTSAMSTAYTAITGMIKNTAEKLIPAPRPNEFHHEPDVSHMVSTADNAHKAEQMKQLVDLKTFFPPQIKMNTFAMAATVVPPKTRVETQMHLGLFFEGLPVQYRRIRFADYTIAKPKFMTHPQIAPDTLELHTMLVSASAVELWNPASDSYPLLEKALANARAKAINPPSPENTSTKPEPPMSVSKRKATAGALAMSGEEIKLCAACMNRENTRANRKKSKGPKPAEEERWMAYAPHRVVIINSQAVKELEMVRGSDLIGKPVLHTEVQVRISCYCRHHEEKKGFRIIFTAKDYQNNIVAQTLSYNVMITDDHKTLPAAPTTPAPPLISTPPSLASFQRPKKRQFSEEESLSPNPNGYGQSMPNIQYSTYLPISPPYSNAPVPMPIQTQHGMPMHFNQHQQMMDQGPAAKKRRGRKPSRPGMSPTDGSTPRSRNGSLQLTVAFDHNGNGMTPVASNHVSPAVPQRAPVPLTVNTATPATTPPQRARQDSGGVSPTDFSNNYNRSGQFSFTAQLNSAQHSFGGSATPSRSREQRNSVDVGYGNSLLSPFSSRATSNASAPGSPPTGNFSSVTSLDQLDSAERELEYLLAGGDGMDTSFLDVPQQPDYSSYMVPKIDRVLPDKGSCGGGIEVTIVGSQFAEDMVVYFGKVPATTRLHNSGCLLCVVPPSSTPTTVIVSIKRGTLEIPMPPENLGLFTYLPAIAEDVMDLALRLMAQAGADPSMSRSAMAALGDRTLWQPSSPTPSDFDMNVRQCIQSQGEVREEALVNALETLDKEALLPLINAALPNTYHTLLHYASMLGWSKLAIWLVNNGASTERNALGYTARDYANLFDRKLLAQRLATVRMSPEQRSQDLILQKASEKLAAIEQAKAAALARLDDGYDEDSSDDDEEAEGTKTPSVTAEVVEGVVDSSAPVQDSAESPTSETTRRFWGLPGVQSAFLSALQGTQQAIGPQPADGNDDHARDYRESWMRLFKGSIKAAATETDGSPEAIRETLEPVTQSFAAALMQHFTASLQNIQQGLPAMPALPEMPANPVARFVGRPPTTATSATTTGSIVPPAPTELVRSPSTDEYSWRDLFTSPPSYEEIFPQGHDAAPEDLDIDSKHECPQQQQRTAECFSASSSSDESVEVVNCSAGTDEEEELPEPVKRYLAAKGRVYLTAEEKEVLRNHTMRIRRIQSDRKLYFIWIPLLIITLISMTISWGPKVWSVGGDIVQRLQFFAERAKEWRPTIQIQPGFVEAREL